VADHPLRPATDRRLGRPLPHQLANPTRAHPLAINLSPEGLIRYYPKFPWAIPNQRVGSHALLTRLPLSIAGAFDLHVLGLPPAFVLSQDQTLKLKARFWFGLEVNPRNLCVTGTFTQQHHSSRHPAKGNRARRHGDGLKRRDRQSSCFDRPCASALPLPRPSGPPGLRRLRFPFFYLLVKERVIRGQRASPRRSPAIAGPHREDETRLGAWLPRHGPASI
jgi:hypothetical protein